MNQYDKKFLIKNLAMLVFVMLAMKMSEGAGFVVVVPFVFIALFARDSARLFFYLLLTIAMVMGNQWLMPKNMIFSLVQRGMMVTLGVLMSLQLAGEKKSKYIMPLAMVVPYLLLVSVTSLNGWSPIISFLKLFLFTSIYFAYIGVCNRAAGERRMDSGVRIRSAVLAFAIFFIVGSVLLLPFPAIGQLQGEEYLEAVKRGADVTSLFKGMTMQSQSLGPAIAALFTILLGDFVFSIRRADKLYVVLMILCPLLIFKTSSRTAMGSLLAGATFVLWLFARSRGVNKRWKGKVISTSILLICLGSAIVLAFSGVREGILKYALKFGNSVEDIEEVTMDDITKTRQGKWEEGIENFKEKPVLGNGFQVSRSMEGFQAHDIRQVLTAPVEKSVWISAVLEESGVCGFILFVWFVLYVVCMGIKRKGYIGTATFGVLIVTNLGEFSIFSMSYTGGLLWAVVFAGFVLDACRNNNQNKQYGWMPERRMWR